MQTNREDSMMHDEDDRHSFYPQKCYYSNQEGMQSQDMASDLFNSDQPKGRYLTSQLQTGNFDMSGIAKNLNLNFKCDDQNIDMENYSTKASSLDSSQNQIYEPRSPRWTSREKSSKKYVAPWKLLNRRKYKNLLKDFNRDEFGGKNFMKRLDRAEKEENAYSSLTDKVDEMSLDQHLECLSNRYLSNNNIPQNAISTAEDLEMRVIPMSLFSPNIQIILDGKRVYYQTVKKGTMKVKISLPAIINNYEFSKFTSFLKKELESSMTCYDFFQKFNREFLEKGLHIKIKVNKEPILPAKTTLEYLLKLYKSSEAKIKFVQ